MQLSGQTASGQSLLGQQKRKMRKTQTGFLATAWVWCIGFTGMERYGVTSRHRGILMRCWGAGKDGCDDGWREGAGGLPGHCFWVKQEPSGQFGVTEHLPLAGSVLSYVPRPRARAEPSPALTGLLTSRKRT